MVKYFLPDMNEEENTGEEKGDIEVAEALLNKKEILEKTAREYFESGNEDLKKKRYNSALVLFFKCLIALVDIHIYQKTGNTPSSHISRFNICRDKFQEVYNLIDKDFPYYQNSYVQIISKELVEVIKDDAKIMAEKTGIKL